MKKENRIRTNTNAIPHTHTQNALLRRYVDGWDDKSYSEVRQARRVSLESEVDSPSRTWEDVWADGVVLTLLALLIQKYKC